MKMDRALSVVLLLASATTALAAGENSTLKTAVDETQVQGYVATPPTGWTPNFIYGPATPASVTAQAIYVVARQVPTSSSYATTVPTPAALTLISLAGQILSKEDLPSKVQVTSTDCRLTRSLGPPTFGVAYDGCPSLSISVVIPSSLPGKLTFFISKPYVSNNTTHAVGMKAWQYIFDPQGAVGSTDRWLLVKGENIPLDSVYLFSILTQYSQMPAFSAATTKYYVFNRNTPTTTQVFQVTAK